MEDPAKGRTNQTVQSVKKKDEERNSCGKRRANLENTGKGR